VKGEVEVYCNAYKFLALPVVKTKIKKTGKDKFVSVRTGLEFKATRDDRARKALFLPFVAVFALMFASAAKTVLAEPESLVALVLGATEGGVTEHLLLRGEKKLALFPAGLFLLSFFLFLFLKDGGSFFNLLVGFGGSLLLLKLVNEWKRKGYHYRIVAVKDDEELPLTGYCITSPVKLEEVEWKGE